MKAPIVFPLICILFAFFTSCTPHSPQLVEAPREIRLQAYEITENYLGMEYEWGGQDWWQSKGIDCSGLVVNTYSEAVMNSPYCLPFTDAAVANLYHEYTRRTETPEKGDLIFMGEDSITHVAIFEKIEDGKVHFVDAYSEAGDGDTGQVMQRSYEIESFKIKSYGRLLVENAR